MTHILTNPPTPLFDVRSLWSKIFTRRKSLADEMLNLGIPVIETDKMRDHMKITHDANCPTFWKKVLHYIGRVVLLLTLLPLWKFLSPDSSMENRRVFACIAAIPLFFVTFFLPLTLLSALLWVPATALVTTIGALLISVERRERAANGKFVTLFSHWQRHSVQSFKVSDRLPLEVAKRSALAEDEPGVRTFILGVDTDPFLVAVRGYGPWKQTAVIAAWATGTTMDNITY